MGELPNKTKQAFVQLKVDVMALPPCLQRTWHVTINRIMRRNHETLPMSSLCFMRFYSLYAWTMTYLKPSWQWICNRPTLFKFTGRCMEVVLHPARGANHKVGWRKWKEFSDIHSAVQKGWLVTSWQDKTSSEFSECQRFAPCRQFSEPLCSFDSQAESKDWQVVPSGSFLIRYAVPAEPCEEVTHACFLKRENIQWENCSHSFEIRESNWSVLKILRVTWKNRKAESFHVEPAINIREISFVSHGFFGRLPKWPPIFPACTFAAGAPRVQQLGLEISHTDCHFFSRQD